MTSPSVLPKIGLGTFRLKDQAVIDSVSSALALGYRHIDTAQIYGNEAAVGIALQQSEVQRDNIFVTTKVWLDNLHEDDVVSSLQESLERLQLDQVDLALIHWPSPGGEVPIAETLKGLNRARNEGLVSHIGLSNFTIAQVDEAMAAPGGEFLVTNQVEVQPYLANRRLVAHCQQHGLQVTAYGPLAVGKVMDDPVLQAIGEQHQASAAQVTLAWLLARDLVVIPASTKPHHQEANLAARDLKLTDDEMARIDALDRNERITNPKFAPDWDD